LVVSPGRILICPNEYNKLQFCKEKGFATKTQSHKGIYKLKRLGVLVPLWQKIKYD